MGHRILLADDSLTIQKVVELTFAGADYELRTVGSGDRAVALLGDFVPDVGLADAVMPGLTGYDVCEAVKKLPGGEFIPVVMLTGTFEPFDRARADGAGAAAVVTKPFDSHALAGMVRDLIEKAGEARAAVPPPPPEPPPPPPLPPEPEPVLAAPANEIGEDTSPTGSESLPPLEPPAPVATTFNEPPPDSMYATTAIPIFTPEQIQALRPPPPPEAEAPVPEPAPVPPPPVAGYEMDMGGLEDEPPRGDIEADIAAFERSGGAGSRRDVGGFASEAEEAEVGSESVEVPPVGAPLDIQEPPATDLEALAKQATLNDLSRMVGVSSGAGPLSEGDVDRIAQRVVELLGESVVRRVAWDVVPEMAERLVRERLAELERAD